MPNAGEQARLKVDFRVCSCLASVAMNRKDTARDVMEQEHVIRKVSYANAKKNNPGYLNLLAGKNKVSKSQMRIKFILILIYMILWLLMISSHKHIIHP